VPMIECVNKDSHIVSENHYGRYLKSNQPISGGTVSAGLHSLQHIVLAAQFL
jgi:hypothetical protein